MKTNELRVGNWVFEDFERKWEIEDFNNYHRASYGDEISDKIEPIKLTEEWLLDFGFNKTASKFFDINELSLLKRIGTESDYYVYINEALTLTVSYVHELQNLYFALIRKELEFN